MRKLNTDLIEKIIEQIEREPARFKMAYYFSLRGLPFREQPYAPLHGCNTTSCIAGWAIALSPIAGRCFLWIGDNHEGADDCLITPLLAVKSTSGALRFESEPDLAGRLLGLSIHAQDALFYGDWPDEYAHMAERDGAVALLRRMVETRSECVLDIVGETINDD